MKISDLPLRALLAAMTCVACTTSPPPSASAGDPVATATPSTKVSTAIAPPTASSSAVPEPSVALASASATATAEGNPAGPTPTLPAPALCQALMPVGAQTLIVANQDGLRELNPDGALVRVLSRSPATRPRFLPGRSRVAFLVPGRAEVRVVSLDNCHEERIATLPRNVGVGCGWLWEAPYDPIAMIRSDDDVTVDAASGAVCLRVMNRNINMASVIVVFDVDPTRRAETHFIAWSDGCGKVPTTSTAPAHRCWRALTSMYPRDDAPRTPPAVFSYRLNTDRVVQRLGGRDRDVVRLAATDVTPEALSPSGRWLVFSCNRVEGDHIYRQTLLLDQLRGDVFPVRTGAWPAALTREQLTDAEKLKHEASGAQGETTVRWLRAPEALVADETLVRPGQAAVDLEGTVAW